MPFDIPLPKNVPDAPLGGRIFGVYNALTQNALANRKQELENQYMPLKTQAQAASQMAYAKLLGPQYVAKMLGNENILAQLNKDQIDPAIQTVSNAGLGNASGLGTGNSNNSLFNPSQKLSPIEHIVNSLKQMFGSSIPQSNAIPNQMNSMQASNQQLQNNAANIPSNIQQQLSTSTQSIPAQNNADISNYDKNGNNIIDPNEVNKLDLSRNADNQQSAIDKIADFQGRKAEGIEQGKIRAKQEAALSDQVKTGKERQNNIDEIGRIVTSPIYESIRQIPIANQHEISYYAKFGTPEQQNLIGNFLARSGEIVQQTASGFKGSFRGFENSLINSMKVSPSDMPEVARGKVMALSAMSKFTNDRNELAESLMNTYHMDQSQAFRYADKYSNGPQIRKQLEDQFQPTVKIKNAKGEKKTVSLEEARRLGVPNV